MVGARATSTSKQKPPMALNKSATAQTLPTKSDNSNKRFGSTARLEKLRCKYDKSSVKKSKDNLNVANKVEQVQ